MTAPDGTDRDLVVATVRELLGDFPAFVLSADRPWDDGLWTALDGAGLTGVGVPESAGGSGGEFADAVAVVATLAAGAGAVPLAEQLLVAFPALLAADLPLPTGAPVTVALDGAVTAEPSDDGDGPGRWTLDGRAVDVPWAGVAGHAVVLAAPPAGIAGGVLALVEVRPATASWTAPAANLAGEPRGALQLDAAPASGALLHPAQVDALRARFALARAVQLSAALEAILAATVRYAGERQQFGRPLARFQAVQTELAAMAGEVTASAALVDAAVQDLARDAAEAPVLAAAAKVRAGAAVAVVARLAHQVHGAIGFTQEFGLHHLTRRCWSWRDEAGGEATWSRRLGAALVADGPDQLWPALTRLG